MRQNHVDSKRTRMLRARAFLTFEFVSLLASCRSVRRHTQVPAAKTCFIIIRTSKFGQLARAAEFSAARQRLSSVATSTRTTRGITHPEPGLGVTAWSEPLKWHTELGTVSGKGTTGEEETVFPEISA